MGNTQLVLKKGSLFWLNNIQNARVDNINSINLLFAKSRADAKKKGVPFESVTITRAAFRTISLYPIKDCI